MTAVRDKAEMIVRAARGWVGTPYRHRASLCGAGADCLGLIRGVWRECLGEEPCALPIYSSDWFEDGPDDVMMRAFGSVFLRVEQKDARSGDVVIFRFRRDAICKHAGLLSDRPNSLGLIHAYSRRGVVETSFDQPWQRRAAGFYRFPARSS